MQEKLNEKEKKVVHKRKRLNDAAKYGYSDEEWESFHKCKRSQIRHPEAYKESYKKWANKQSTEYHHARGRKSQLKLNYGITPEIYNEMLSNQENSCAICKTNTPTGRWKVFAVDHCHLTNKIRGLLCNECNRGMGLLKDNAGLLRAAADYLDFHNKGRNDQL
ncbi:endonuclease VII domain-containing protein [Candidatus Pacearchaeota archaeon]|nr:endonuclease VII domain-containing protein [Candidatus Pacearchaeota archaeon]